MARAAGKKQGKQRVANRAKRAVSKRAKRAVPKRAKRAVPKRVSAKRAPAKRTLAKRTPAKRAPAKRAPAKRTPAKRVPAKRTPAKRPVPTPRSPKRTVPPPRLPAPPRRPAPVPPAFAVQRADASARENLLFELQRARTSVKAALQGLTTGTAERPIAPGKWSIKEIVLHLSERDRVRLEEFARTLGGTPRSWAGIEDPAMAGVNETHLAPLRAHTWDEAVRRLDAMREELLHRLHEVPAVPDDVWQGGHAFADMMWGLPDHDRHHADQIKLARIGEALPVED